MKKTINILLIACFISSFSFAQSKESSWQKVEASKISFLTNELSLTPLEAEKFWPVYNNYRAETKKLKLKKNQSIFKKLKSTKGNISNQMAISNLNQMMDIENKIHKIKIEYYNKSIAVLGPQKAIKLKLAELEFNRKIIKKLRKKSK